MISKNDFVVLTENGNIKSTQTHFLIKNNLTDFIRWDCEVFSHTKNINSQTGKTGYTACGNKSTTCNVGICSCPTDIYLPKGANEHWLFLLREKVRKLSNKDILETYQLHHGKIVACGQLGLLVNTKFVIDWNLLRRCNFSCTYCAPDIHSYTSEFPSWEQIQQEFNDIKIPTGKEAYFNLNGGEPTLHPNILDIVKMCNNVGYVELLSNGTASVTMYNTLLDYAKINISLHHELINEKHMKKFVKIAELNKGELVFKYFNTFNEEKYKEYLDKLSTFNHVSIITNKRIIQRGQRDEAKSWAT